MKVNIKSIISLSILIAFIISPFIVVSFDCKEEDENIEVKKVIEVKDKNVSIKQKEVKNKEENIKEENKEKIKRENKNESKNKEKDKEKQEPKDNKRAFHLSSYERKIVECVVMGEASGEPYEGQVLVAFCILNACLKDELQPSEVRRIYKYSGWNERPSESVKKAVSRIFDDGHKPVNDTPLYFYAPKYCNSSWHETQRYICTIGGHKFFGRWK